MEQINDICNRIAGVNALETFEKYYHDDVMTVLEDGTAAEGKDRNREREKEFFASAEAFNGLDVKSITSHKDDGTTTVECVMDVTFEGGDCMDLEQVAVQQWEDDPIVCERFYATQNG